MLRFTTYSFIPPTQDAEEMAQLNAMTAGELEAHLSAHKSAEWKRFRYIHSWAILFVLVGGILGTLAFLIYRPEPLGSYGGYLMIIAGFVGVNLLISVYSFSSFLHKHCKYIRRQRERHLKKPRHSSEAGE